jgi:hypothetical protein
MSVDQEIFTDGHVDPSVLRDFAERPDDFDEDIVEKIWQHLEECDVCIEEYESIHRGGASAAHERPPAEPPAPAPVDEGVADSQAFDADDLKVTVVEQKKQDDSHMNGLMPVGDDPTRNGVPDEYRNGERRATITLDVESPIDAPGEGEHGEEAASDEPGESKEVSDRRQTLKAPEIEGLITGELHLSEERADRLETESAVEAGARMTREGTEHRVASHGGAEKTDISGSDDVEERPWVGVSEPEDEVIAAGEEPPAIPGAEPKPPSRPSAETKPAPRPSTEPKPAPRPRNARSAPARPASRPAAGTTHTTAKKSEPLEDLLNKALALLTRPRNAIIFGAGVLLVVAAIVATSILTGGEKERLVAGWEPLDVVETRVPLQEVLVRTMRRGRIPRASGPDVTLDFRGVDRLVIAVDLDFINSKTTPYDLIVRDPAGVIVFQERIPQLYLDDGRFFLRLIPEQFEVDQTYKLELAVHRADDSMLVVAESVFDVLK